MIVAGVDLSGPSNSSHTAIAWFSDDGADLSCSKTVVGADDRTLFELFSGVAHDGGFVVGLDAPLSYNPGGGDRPGDFRLRRRLMQVGLRSGSVMTPTMTRMVYLTLRGVCVARALETIRPHPPRIVEVHPSGSLALRGAPIEAVRKFKTDGAARTRLLRWLEAQGLRGVASLKNASDHLVAACACAHAAWKWARNEAVWCEQAAAPLHPYDFAC